MRLDVAQAGLAAAAPGGRADALRQSIFDTSAKYFPSPYNLSSNSWNVSKHRGFSWTGRIVDRMERGRLFGPVPSVVRTCGTRNSLLYFYF
mgnify:CR=1 FL=1